MINPACGYPFAIFFLTCCLMLFFDVIAVVYRDKHENLLDIFGDMKYVFFIYIWYDLNILQEYFVGICDMKRICTNNGFYGLEQLLTRVLAIASLEFGDFNHGFNVFRYKLEVSTSIAINTIDATSYTATLASNFTATSVASREINNLGYEFIAVLILTAKAIITIITSENKNNENISNEPHTQSQIKHLTAPAIGSTRVDNIGCIFEQYDALPSATNNTICITYNTPTTTFNFDAIDVGLATFNENQYNLIAVLPVTSIATTQRIKNKNEMRIDNEETPADSLTTIMNKILNYDLMGAESRDFNDLKCVFAALLNGNEFDCDIDNVFKYFFNDPFDEKGYCNASNRTSPGM